MSRGDHDSRPAAPSLILAAILLLGSAIILPRLGQQSLWVDEGLTIRPALDAGGVRDLVARVRAVDTQPPASHLVLWALRDVLPRSEFFFRLPSFLAIEAGLVVLYLLVARLWRPSIALLCVALAQISPYLVFFAAEARNYGLWFLAIVVSWYAFARWHEAQSRADAARARWWTGIAWACANAAGLWLHLFHVFVIVAQGAVVLVLVSAAHERRFRVRYAASAALWQLLAVLLFAPWLLVLTRGVPGEVGVGWTRPFSAAVAAYQVFALHFGTSLGPDLRDLHDKPFASLVAESAPSFAAGGAAIALTAICLAIAVRDATRERGRRWELLPFVVMPLAGAVAPVAYAVMTRFPLHPRHLLFLWPVLPLVLAVTAVRRPAWRIAVAAVAALQLVALYNLLVNPYYAKDDERGAIAFAESQSQGTTYVLGDVAFYYCTTTRGRPHNFLHFAPETEQVWLIDNRTWEPENQQFRARLEEWLTSKGFTPRPTSEQFRGIVLRHWTLDRLEPSDRG